MEDAQKVIGYLAKETAKHDRSMKEMSRLFREPGFRERKLGRSDEGCQRTHGAYGIERDVEFLLFSRCRFFCGNLSQIFL